MDKDALLSIEKNLLTAVAKIEVQIKELNAEKSALQRQIAKTKANRTGLKNVTRKNSINRVLAETSVIEALRENKNPRTTKQLYLNALGTNISLNENTFRNYLHRMKKRNLIETAGHVGMWRLARVETADLF